MAEGTVKRLTDKGYGFIDTGGGPGTDMFFPLVKCRGRFRTTN